ncbi:Aste57867_11069 [Aphanomyces stellatus]|uniref:Aste57867_11069 protein n=1 Tax=Aphanomyces stellatus TaxID=120398 RepID=A0A485KSJ5_9STRA|nr:hypothetical protein As57867_011027 [Aphanomyces stellatus]VFT87937.1 Aste57867_11069 [Aphanomyces stellatus]
MALFSTYLFAAVAAASAVHAHVSCVPPTATANTNVLTAIRVPHSFPGATTLNVTVTVPTGVTAVRPQNIGGWKLAVSYQSADFSQDSHGGLTNNEVASITWYDGVLPDFAFQDFAIQFKVGDIPAGTVYYFPTVQFTTPNGTLAWNSTPDASGKLADPNHPAPKLLIVSPTTAAPQAVVTAPAKSTASLASMVSAIAVALVSVAALYV